MFDLEHYWIQWTISHISWGGNQETKHLKHNGCWEKQGKLTAGHLLQFGQVNASAGHFMFMSVTLLSALQV